MADWIKVETTTPDKPEIVMIAAVLKIDQDAAFGKCFRAWAWADQHTVDGNAVSVTDSFLDRLTNCDGFAAAMRKVGWLGGKEASIAFPNFSRHNGQSAKNRALTKTRVHAHRCNASSVTSSISPSISSSESVDEGAGRRRPTLNEARASGEVVGVTEKEAEEWWHSREANEWMKGTSGGGTTPVGRNWQSDMKTFTNHTRNRAQEKLSRVNGNGSKPQKTSKFATW